MTNNRNCKRSYTAMGKAEATFRIESGVPLEGRRSPNIPAYDKAQQRALEIYRSYHAVGLSIYRAVQIAVGDCLKEHIEASDYARAYVPATVRAGGADDEMLLVWALPRAKGNLSIVRAIHARVCKATVFRQK
jgi:hypothetical protein